VANDDAGPRGSPDDDPGDDDGLTPDRARQLARLHAFASSVSGALLRLRDPRELCEAACRFAVERGLAVLAWVGTVDERSIAPVARFGRDDGYVDLIRLEAGGGTTGSGPAARALGSMRPMVSTDIATDPSFHWRDEATRRGLRSCAVIPLHLGGRPAVLALYADAVGAYRHEEVQVLAALGENLSFAVASSETAAERARLVQTLGERVKELTLLHRAARLILSDGPLDEPRLRELVELVPAAWQHPDRCRARIRSGSVVAETPGFRATSWHLCEPLRGADGEIEVAYIEPPDPAGQPFLLEEREVLRSLAEMVSARLARDAAEAEQRRRAALLRMAGTAARIGGWSLDVVSGRVTISDELRRILEVPPDAQLDADAAGRLFAPESRDDLFSRFAECAASGTPFDVEGPALTGTGRRIWVRVIGHAEHAADGTVVRVEGATQDLHERRRLEDELRQAQKMEAIGRLAGGVAHDFNNLLSVILSYASFIVEALPEGDAVRGDAEEVVRAGQRAAELTRRLLAFSRQQLVQPSVLGVHDVVAGLEPMLRRLLAEDVRLEVRTRGVRGRALADRGQLEQILMNLVVNARDAMPGGGVLTIETAELLVDEASGGRRDVPAGRYVQLCVQDTGVGMDDAVRARAFDPFFTTKPTGAGTGLGLSTVYGIVTQCRGHVRLESEPGAGTRIEIILPSVDAPLTAPTERPPPVPSRAAETILVVEDMDQVREAVATVLARGGYHVVKAGSGPEALRICGEHPGAIDLLLTDVVMPQMSGPALVAKASALRPAMQILYMSGHAEEEIVDRGGAHGEVAFIAKPIVPGELLRKIRELLGGGRPEVA
jgi:signal transduction histidine kinase